MSHKEVLKKIKRFENLPTVEQTPFIWDGKLMLVETWHDRWDHQPWKLSFPHHESKHIRIREEKTNNIISRFARGYGFSSAYVADGMIYVFLGKSTGSGNVNVVCMTKSSDLVNWSEPIEVLSEPEPVRVFNQSVCHDGKRYVMAYETDEGVPFTLKFAESDDLVNWTKVEGSTFGLDRYVACPALRFSEGYYYMMYLERKGYTWWFETFMVRSKDLISWEPSPNNPLIVPDNDQPVAKGCPAHDEECGKNCNGRECNNSDPDIVEWEGKTRVYFTGGCQHYGGVLQYAEYDGSMEKFFKACYE